MDVGEIINYLRTETQTLVFNVFDREGVQDCLDVTMSEEEWKDFIKYCSRNDVDGVFAMTEELIELWRWEKTRFPLDYNYKKAG